MRVFLIRYIPARLVGAGKAEQDRHCRTRMFHEESRADQFIRDLLRRGDLRLHESVDVEVGGGLFRHQSPPF
jgi:hypothetical protein